MTKKEALAKRIEAGEKNISHIAQRILTSANDLSGAQDYIDAMERNDVTAALAIKDALYPNMNASCDDWNDSSTRFRYSLIENITKPGDQDEHYRVVGTGKSNTLSHAIMAALVRATKEDGK